jgi:inner membrane protein
VYRSGHYGVSLLVYSPVAFALLVAGEVTLAFVAGAAVLWLATLPDVDHRIPGVTHRGVTHTVAFALAVGAVFGAAGYLLAGTLRLSDSLAVAGFGAFVGSLGIAAHIVGDVLTPAGVRPFWPLSRRKYTLSLTRADSTLWNVGLFAVGVFVTAAVLVVAGTVAGVIPL